MAQIIKHRRGSLESLTSVTSSLSKGELVIASGSSNISPTNGSSIVFAAAENGQIQAVNRVMRGTTVPNTFSNATYNGLLNGVPYYVSASNVLPTLYLLGTDSNEAINLVGNIQEFSTSVDSRLDSLEASGVGSIALLNQYTASADSRFAAIQTVTSSLNSFTASTAVSLTNLNLSSASQQVSINALNVSTSSLNSFTASTAISITNINSATASLLVETANLELFTSSAAISITNLNASSASQQISINALNVSSGSLNSFTASTAVSLTNLNSFTASNATSLTNINSFTASTAVSLTNLNASSASQQVSINALNTYTSSNDTTNTTQNNRLDSLSNKTGSYATTGSNTFIGTQVFSGSVYIQNDLVVIGSSSISNISASAVSIGDNQIVLNTFTPAIRFGGISVVDSGSTGATGSLFWDSVNNHWLYQHPSGANEGYNSAILISGPKNTGSLGDEIGLTTNTFTVAVGEDHISSSIMSQATDNTKVTIAGGLDVTGTISGSINGIGNVTAFSSSVDSRLDAVELSIGGGSISASIAALNVATASLNTFTASTATSLTNLNTFTSSAAVRLTNLESKSASVDVSITNLNASSASQQVSINALSAGTASVNSFTASTATSLTNLNSATASLIVETTNLELFTASAATRLTNLESKSASVDISVANINLYTASVSNSVLNLNLSTASQQVSINALSAGTASVNSFTASTATSLTNLNSFTASTAVSLTNLNASSASQQVSINALSAGTASVNSFTASTATSLTNLNASSASQQVSIDALNVATSSINSYTSSLKSAISVNGSNLTVIGDLTVQGSTVTFNTTELVVEDKLIVLASGSTNAAQADGSGILISGSGASFTYAATPDLWTANRPFSASAFTGSFNIPTGGSSKRLVFRETTGNLDLVTAPTTDGDLLQWNGTAFTMSNVIDGGSF